MAKVHAPDSPEELMRQNLIAMAQAYAHAKGWALATVSKEIHGNQAFLEGYLNGEMSPTTKKYFAMMKHLVSNMPESGRIPDLAFIHPLGKTVDNPAAAA